MKYRLFPQTDLRVSQIALGTWAFGGDVYGDASEEDCVKAVQAALDSGITLIDTAPIYGYGRSEKLVGKALVGRRDKAVIATKCGLVGKGARISHDLSPQSINQEIEASLKRLNTDYIDLYQCHWPDSKTDFSETLKALKSLQASGKIRHIGVSNFPIELLKVAAQQGGVVSLQSQFSLLERELEDEILPFVKEKRIGFLAYGVLGGGILTGKYRTQPQVSKGDVRSFFYHFYKGENFQKVQELLKVFEGINKPFAEIALNWVRQNSATTSVLVGCRNKTQVEANIKALEWDLTEEEVAQLSEFEFKS